MFYDVNLTRIKNHIRRHVKRVLSRRTILFWNREYKFRFFFFEKPIFYHRDFYQRFFFHSDSNRFAFVYRPSQWSVHRRKSPSPEARGRGFAFTRTDGARVPTESVTQRWITAAYRFARLGPARVFYDTPPPPPPASSAEHDRPARRDLT